MAEFLVVARANINLVHGVTTPEHIRVEQYDGNWDKQLQLTLYDEADLYPIPIEVASIVISGAKRDGTGFSYFCTWDGATVYAPLMQQMTLFDFLAVDEAKEKPKEAIPAHIFDWRSNKSVTYHSLKEQ